MAKYSTKINMKIIEEVEKNSNGEDTVFELIKELLLKEAFSEGKGQWKNEYHDKIESYSNDWRNTNED